RELRNVMERVALLAAGREVTLADLPPALSAGEGVLSGPDEEPHILTLRELEAEHIRRVLGLGVSMERAAELLGINTVTLWRKRKELGA
ncbi:MAG: helix-turn-helix domain-containing protein, partial [Bilophila wadsworthia]